MADSRKEEIVLLLVRIRSGALVLPDLVLAGSLVGLVEARLADTFAKHGRARRTVDDVAEEAPAVGHVPALGKQPCPVGEPVLHGIVVKELIRGSTNLTSSLPLR